jgi:hypothetical protein
MPGQHLAEPSRKLGVHADLALARRRHRIRRHVPDA